MVQFSLLLCGSAPETSRHYAVSAHSDLIGLILSAYPVCLVIIKVGIGDKHLLYIEHAGIFLHFRDVAVSKLPETDSFHAWTGVPS